jgi:Fe-S-cluster-containing hydrogenase component 2
MSLKENRSKESSEEKIELDTKFPPLTRRTFLKGGVVGMAFLTGAAGVVNTLEALTLPDGWAVTLTKGVVVGDPELCSGCRTCEAVCTNYNSKGHSSSAQARIILEKDYLKGKYEVNTCFQCVKPLCLHICPEEAIKVDTTSGTNARVIDDILCIGCGRCIEACGSVFTPPRPRFDPESEQVVKCDLCHGDPQCVKYCPYGALRYEWSEKGILTGYPVLREG